MLSRLARVTRACSWPSVSRKPLISPRDAFCPSSLIFNPVKIFSRPSTLPWKNPVELIDPGATSRKLLTSRPLIGNPSTCAELSVVPVTAELVSTVVDVPVTVTVSDVAETASDKFTFTEAPTVRLIGLLFAASKPVAFTSTRYTPYGKADATNNPFESVPCVWTIPVPVFVIVTLACGTTAPVGSVTVPVTVPVSKACANAGGAEAKRQNNATSTAPAATRTAAFQNPLPSRLFSTSSSPGPALYIRLRRNDSTDGPASRNHQWLFLFPHAQLPTPRFWRILGSSFGPGQPFS